MDIKSLFKRKPKEESNLWELERTENTIWPEINCNHWFQQIDIDTKEDSCTRTFKCTKCVAEKKAYYKKIIKNKEGDKK